MNSRLQQTTALVQEGNADSKQGSSRKVEQQEKNGKRLGLGFAHLNGWWQCVLLRQWE